MPNARQTAAAASNETLALLPSIPHRSGTDPTSYLYQSTEPLPPLPPSQHYKLRTTVILDDAFDVAIEWQNDSFSQDSPLRTSPLPFPSDAQGTDALDSGRPTICGQRAPPVNCMSILQGEATNRILVLNTAHEKEPGGAWEKGGLTQEEVFSRRSNLAQTLTTTDSRLISTNTYYPMPQTGAIYSPSVVVFREGFSKDYALWRGEDWATISTVSASAVRRPKIHMDGPYYAFMEEKNLQREKMKSILRVAALNGHINLVLGGFGSYGQEGNGNGGGLYRNPIGDVCCLWHELLRLDEEFIGWFAKIVFALGDRGDGWMKEDDGGVKIFQSFFD